MDLQCSHLTKLQALLINWMHISSSKQHRLSGHNHLHTQHARNVLGVQSMHGQSVQAYCMVDVRGGFPSIALQNYK